MLEADIEFLFEFLAEIFIELLTEVVFGLGWEGVAASFKKQKAVPAPIAYMGYLMLGSALGALSGVALPYRFSHDDGLSILGVVANAVLGGALMHFYGNHRRRHGKTTTHLATFWGGAWFAFGIAAGRLGMVVVLTR